MWQGVNEKELNEPLLDEGEAGSRPSADEPRKDGGWISKVIPGYSAPPTTATTPSTYSPRTNGGAGGGGGLAGDAFWAKNTGGPSSSPQKGGGGGSGGLLSKVLDVVVGPDIEPYGFILGSLEEGDERHLKQLNTTLPNDKTIPGTSNTRKAVFKKLESTGYERSIVPFASDANPLGDVGALGVGLVVRDGMWGPDLLEESTDDQGYWQIIGAAQELAINVVFIFIRHRDSMHLEPGEVCHQKFKRLAKGPWPQKQPYVFLMSYWGHLNDKHIEVIKTCLAIKDPLEVKLAINRLVVKNVPKDDTNGAAIAMTQSAPDLALPSSKEKGKKGWLFSSTGGLRNSSKGKEKEGGATARGGGGNSQEEWRQFKKKLLKKNRKQMTMLMAAELHEMRERDRHVLKLETKVEELTKEVDRLKEELKLAKGV